MFLESLHLTKKTNELLAQNLIALKQGQDIYKYSSAQKVPKFVVEFHKKRGAKYGPTALANDIYDYFSQQRFGDMPSGITVTKITDGINNIMNRYLNGKECGSPLYGAAIIFYLVDVVTRFSGTIEVHEKHRIIDAVDDFVGKNDDGSKLSSIYLGKLDERGRYGRLTSLLPKGVIRDLFCIDAEKSEKDAKKIKKEDSAMVAEFYLLKKDTIKRRALSISSLKLYADLDGETEQGLRWKLDSISGSGTNLVASKGYGTVIYSGQQSNNLTLLGQSTNFNCTPRNFDLKNFFDFSSEQAIFNKEELPIATEKLLRHQFSLPVHMTLCYQRPLTSMRGIMTGHFHNDMNSPWATKVTLLRKDALGAGMPMLEAIGALGKILNSPHALQKYFESGGWKPEQNSKVNEEQDLSEIVEFPDTHQPMEIEEQDLSEIFEFPDAYQPMEILGKRTDLELRNMFEASKYRYALVKALDMSDDICNIDFCEHSEVLQYIKHRTDNYLSETNSHGYGMLSV